MERSPPVSLDDAAEDVIGDADGGAGRERNRARLLGLGVAAAIGFAAAQAVPWPGDSPGGPSLALVVGRQPYLGATEADAPETTMEVALVNTGTSVARLEGAVVAGSELMWEAEKPLEAGE